MINLSVVSSFQQILKFKFNNKDILMTEITNDASLLNVYCLLTENFTMSNKNI